MCVSQINRHYDSTKGTLTLKFTTLCLFVCSCRQVLKLIRVQMFSAGLAGAGNEDRHTAGHAFSSFLASVTQKQLFSRENQRGRLEPHRSGLKTPSPEFHDENTALEGGTACCSFTVEIILLNGIDSHREDALGCPRCCIEHNHCLSCLCAYVASASFCPVV